EDPQAAPVYLDRRLELAAEQVEVRDVVLSAGRADFVAVTLIQTAGRVIYPARLRPVAALVEPVPEQHQPLGALAVAPAFSGPRRPLLERSPHGIAVARGPRNGDLQRKRFLVGLVQRQR